jgi:signal transduction histidine kinase
VLTAALAAFAITNLLFGALPAAGAEEPSDFATWAPVGSRLLSALLLAVAAFAPERRVRRPRRAATLWLGGTVAGLVVIGLVVAAIGDGLPEALPSGVSPEDSNRPLVVGNAAVLALQLVIMLLNAAAAFGLARAYERTQDALLGWFAIAAVLGAFARLNYFLYPSIYTEWFYTGDILRLGFFLLLLAGVITELTRSQRAHASAAVLEERRRLARDLHDGMAQDLAFIVQFGRAIARRDEAPRGIREIVTAAERALDDSRHAIAALVRPSDEPFPAALARTTREAATREGAEVDLAVGEVAVPESAGQELLRVAREAVTNAARHGHAHTIRVELVDEPPLRLRIADDGNGFDVDAAVERPGRRGLAGMRERVQRLGGEVTIRSEPGEGAVVEVTLP